MENKTENSVAVRQLINALFIPSIIVIFMIFVFLFERGMGLDLHTAGIYPRRIENWWGIFTYIFIHSGWSHLINNVLSFLILAGFLYYFYRQIATQVLVLSYLFSGIILWLIGRESWHIGASGLIYALAFFLFLSGLIRNYVPLIAVSLIVTLIYGNMVWHLFPWQVNDPISWEGHLAGGLTGIALAIFKRNNEPQKPIYNWSDEDLDNDFEAQNIEITNEIEE